MGWTMRMMAILVLIVAGAATGRSAAAATEIYGLVIGIDNYTGLAPKLQGAVNDARDVADALTKSGAREVKLLIDGAANRDAIMAAWDALLGRAKKGDILIFHYAGHGGQEPEHVKGSEATGYDSTLLLPAFDIQGEGTRERLIDDELGWMFKRASDAGITVLVVIDACHSGSMTRAFDNAAVAKPRVRAATYPPILITDDRLPPFPPAWAEIPEDLPNVIYFGAVQDDEEAPEVVINGQVRGALSWALAQGLRGGADARHDGVITKEELQAFITENIRMQLEGRQHPSVIPPGFRALAFPAPAGAKGPLEAAASPLDLAVPLAIIHTSGVDAAALAASLKGVMLADAGGTVVPAVIWDVAAGRITAADGQVVADFAADPTRGIRRTDSPPAAPPAHDGRSDLPKVQAALDLWRQTATRPPAESGGALTLAVINTDRLGPEDLTRSLRGVKPVAVNADPAPMLTWDVARGQVFTNLGDLVYQFGDRKADDPTRGFTRAVAAGDNRPANDGRGDLPKFQDVVDNWQAVQRIKRLAESRSLQMALKPDDKRHTDGAKLTFVIEGHNQTYFTLFNLGSDGTVNFLYPLDTAEVKDPLQIPLGRAYTVPLVVEAPYGADHLVAIASAQPLTALHKTLQEFDGKPMANALVTVLLKDLEGQTYQIGVHGSYTAAAKP